MLRRRHGNWLLGAEAQEISANLAGKGYNDMFKLRCGYLLGSKTRRNPALPVDALCGVGEFPLGTRVAHFRLRPHLFQVAARCCALALPEQRAKEIAAPDISQYPRKVPLLEAFNFALRGLIIDPM